MPDSVKDQGMVLTNEMLNFENQIDSQPSANKFKSTGMSIKEPD